MTKTTAGELLLVGVPGPEMDSATAARLKKLQPGGFILFGRNIVSATQLRKLTDDLRERVDGLIAQRIEARAAKEKAMASRRKVMVGVAGGGLPAVDVATPDMVVTTARTAAEASTAATRTLLAREKTVSIRFPSCDPADQRRQPRDASGRHRHSSPVS